jgi:hypothetical protein
MAYSRAAMNEVTILYIVTGVVAAGLTAWVGWALATRKQAWALTPAERDQLLGLDEEPPKEAKDEKDEAKEEKEETPPAEPQEDEPAKDAGEDAEDAEDEGSKEKKAASSDK